MCSTQQREIAHAFGANPEDVPALTLEERVEQLERELIDHATATVLEVERLKRMTDELAERTAQGLAHLAVAIVESRTPKRTERIAAFFRRHVYDGTPVRYTTWKDTVERV
jgi:hypothetical protein